MKNHSLEKSLRLLTSPLSLFAIVLLLVNDHILRVFWPSWFTGKLGDFAWLYFMPFVFATILSLVLPESWKNKDRIVGLAAFGLVIGSFILGNSLLSWHLWFSQILRNIFQLPINITHDPSDLIALSTAGLAGYHWQKEIPLTGLPNKRGLLLLPLCGILTLANGMEATYGIDCLEIVDNKIIASVYWEENFSSSDGGLSWQPIEELEENNCTKSSEIIEAPENQNILFRITEGAAIEQSDDGGKTWHSIPEIQFASEAEIAFYLQNRIGGDTYSRGPLSWVIDSATHNIIFGMGLEGVLVRTAEGDWVAVPVGRYHVERLTLSKIPSFLLGEMLLGAQMIILAFVTPGLVRKGFSIKKIVLFFLWGVLFAILLLQPAKNIGYGLFLQWLLFISSSIFVILILIDHLIKFHKRILPDVWHYLKISLFGYIGFLTPFLLWAFNIIQNYLVCLVLSISVSALVAIIQYFSQKNLFLLSQESNIIVNNNG